jgi:hypothetical protein
MPQARQLTGTATRRPPRAGPAGGIASSRARPPTAGAARCATGSPLVEAARDLASDLLGDLDGRWRHTRSVARRAADATTAVPQADRPVLVAAAWLHDIGYASTLRASGFHPLDGAWHVHELG